MTASAALYSLDNISVCEAGIGAAAPEGGIGGSSHRFAQWFQSPPTSPGFFSSAFMYIHMYTRDRQQCAWGEAREARGVRGRGGRGKSVRGRGEKGKSVGGKQEGGKGILERCEREARKWAAPDS